MAEPAARDGSIPLLELGGPPPADAEISISAIPTAGNSNKQDAKAFLRYALDQELYRGVEELRGLSKASIAGHQFFLFETRRGIEQHVVLATTSATTSCASFWRRMMKGWCTSWRRRSTAWSSSRRPS